MSELEKVIENLREDFHLFERTLNKIIFARIHLKENDRQINQFNELIQDLQDVTDRIKKDIEAVKRLMSVSKTWNEKVIKESNLSLSDLFTTYEIVIARYKTYVDKFGYQDPLDILLKTCTNYMSQLDQLLYDFNLKNNLKLLVPSKESEIVKIIMNSGYQVVTERDWGKLVVYR